MDDVLLSVCVITYNHEKYISQTLDSILMQKTTFLVEVVIGEDCSTDDTRNICFRYQEKFPDKIKMLLPERNLGMMPNFIATLKACKGKYIAICEGDDYWIDSYKLQKQVSFLKQNPECSICAHNSFVINNSDLENVGLFNSSLFSKNKYSINDYILDHKWFVPTASIVFRVDKMDYPSWLPNIKNGDVAIQLILLMRGYLYYFNEVMSVYRKLETSVSHIYMKTLRQTYIQLLDIFDKYSEFKFHIFLMIKKQFMQDLIKKDRHITIQKIINKLLSSQGFEIKKKLPLK